MLFCYADLYEVHEADRSGCIHRRNIVPAAAQNRNLNSEKSFINLEYIEKNT